jgi:ferredoxin
MRVFDGKAEASKSQIEHDPENGFGPCVFDVQLDLARSGRSFEIPPSKPILEVLLDAGVEVPFSCMQGGAAPVRLKY